MKIHIYIISLFFTINLFSQNCKLNKKIDEFDNFETTNTKLFNLASKGFADFVNVQLYKFKQKDSIAYSIYVTLNTGFAQCVTKESYVSIKFTNDEVLKLNRTSNEIDCGSYSMFVGLDFNELNKIYEQNIDMIRVNIEYQKDYKIKEKPNEKFKSLVECIINDK